MNEYEFKLQQKQSSIREIAHAPNELELLKIIAYHIVNIEYKLEDMCREITK